MAGAEKKTTELDSVDILGVEDEFIGNVMIDGQLKTRRFNAQKVSGLGRTLVNVISATAAPGVITLDETEHLGALLNLNNTEDAVRIDLPDYGSFQSTGLICTARVANGSNPVSVRCLVADQLRTPQHSAPNLSGDEIWVGTATADADEDIIQIWRSNFSWVLVAPFGVRNDPDGTNRLSGGGGGGGAVDSVVGETGTVTVTQIVNAITANQGSDDWLGPDDADRRYGTGGGKTGTFAFVAADETGARWIDWQGSSAADTATLDAAVIPEGGVIEGERNSLFAGDIALTGGLTSPDSLTIAAGSRFSIIRTPGSTRVRVSQA